MPNPRKPVPGRHLSIIIEEADATQMDLHLWSVAEQRIPYAARQKFLTKLLRDFFGGAALDLAPYLPGLPHGTQVRGSPEAILALQLHLEEAFLRA